MKKIITVLCVVVLLAACSGDPRDTKLSGDMNTWKTDSKVSEAISKLTEDEQKLFASYMMKAVFSQAFSGVGIRDGITIREILEEERTSIAKKAAENLEEKAREEAAAVETAGYLSFLEVSDVKVSEVSFGGYSSDKIKVEGHIKNIGDKTLRSVEATFFYLDANGSRVGEKTFNAVLASSDTYSRDKRQPLRPNYEQEFFTYVDVDEVPRGWAKEIELEISDIEFSD